ncbi:MAG: hypothetical protein K6F91_08940 [Ruminococcus sp.]|nr:hypothetical protein [Ruminococcus sp.]
MKELIENYKELLTKIEERINYITSLMRSADSKESLKSLRIRRDTLKEEYDDLIYAMKCMSKYSDLDSSHTVIREVNAV